MVKPEAGQWWASTMGNRVQIVGVKADGMVVFETRGGNYNDEHIQEITGFWTHMKDCTGWDWQPDTEPEWFDLTPFDEHVLRENVDYFLSAIDAGAWKVVRVLDGETVGDIKDCGYTLFRCLLKDAPPELVAKAKQTESPDDWVTQDRVPARPGIDERQWVQYDGTALGWVPVKKIGCWSGMKHGDVIHGDRLELRCRRKDLPPLPEQPKTETVVFYEVISATQSNRYLHFVETPVEGVHIPTGRTETREVVR